MQKQCPHCGTIQITDNMLDNVAYVNPLLNNVCAPQAMPWQAQTLHLTLNTNDMQPYTHVYPLAGVACAANSYSVVRVGEMFAPRQGVEPSPSGNYTWTLGDK